jgi:hypothetical protein
VIIESAVSNPVLGNLKVILLRLAEEVSTGVLNTFCIPAFSIGLFVESRPRLKYSFKSSDIL